MKKVAKTQKNQSNILDWLNKKLKVDNKEEEIK